MSKDNPTVADFLAPRNLGTCLCYTKELLLPRYTHGTLYDQSWGIVGLQRTEIHFRKVSFLINVIDIRPPKIGFLVMRTQSGSLCLFLTSSSIISATCLFHSSPYSKGFLLSYLYVNSIASTKWCLLAQIKQTIAASHCHPMNSLVSRE